MNTYSAKALKDWLHRSIGIERMVSRSEANTMCPLCGGDVFYFNIVKGLGVCHRASCGVRVNVFQLAEIIGFGPEETGIYDAPEPEYTPPEVTLPGWPILSRMMGQLMTSDQPALDYLRGRGLDDETILGWGLTSDGQRVYIPIYWNGDLVNYNSRILPPFQSDWKYLYSPGAKTSHYILGWEECKLWSELVLVENTFVSLAYRYRMHATTTFGSNISDVQATYIKDGNAQAVALLWDANSEKSAERCAKKLHDRGVQCSYWSILGQPDDYPIEWVQERANRVLDAARNGIPYVYLKDECQEYRDGLC